MVVLYIIFARIGNKYPDYRKALSYCSNIAIMIKGAWNCYPPSNTVLYCVPLKVKVHHAAR